MNLNNASNQLQQYAIFFSNIVRSCVLILVWAIVAVASLAVAFVAFRAIWHAVKLALNALGI
jgi:hypothetical protein